MPTLVFPVADIISRLEAHAAIKLVGLAPDLEAALQTPPRVTPAVYVLSSTTGGDIKFSGSPVQQERETTLVLMVWVKHHGKPAAMRAELDAVLAAIDTQLAGYTPSNPPFGALTFKASRDQFAVGQYLVHQAQYASSWNFSAPRLP